MEEIETNNILTNHHHSNTTNDDANDVTMLNNCPSEPGTSDSENNENNMNRKNQQQKSNSKKILEHKACNKKILKELTNVKNNAIRDTENTVSLEEILKSFNAPISEEQAWSLIYQAVAMYKNKLSKKLDKFRDIHAPVAPRNLFVRKDGTVFVNCKNEDLNKCIVSSQKKILLKIGIVVYMALDFNLPSDEECIISSELEQVISYMTLEDADDEGIERDSEDVEDEKYIDTKELDHVLELCTPRITPSSPEDHYRAVCRALATESFELKIFLLKVQQGEAETFRLKAHAQTSRKELEKLNFSDWARFWMQVVDELRRGVRLKKINFPRTRIEYELTPYEALMEDIRSRKYNLKKVMINGDIPRRVKKDAHAVILEFIRSRPPLRKASERTLNPLKRTPSPREILLDSIRQGQTLRPINPRMLKNRLVPLSQVDNVKKSSTEEISTTITTATTTTATNTQSRRRLIPVDFSLFQDDDEFFLDSTSNSSSPAHSINININNNNNKYLSLNDTSTNNRIATTSQKTSSNNENNQNNLNTSSVLRRTRDTITQDEYHRFCDKALETYDLATQCESRRASMRRHTIVGCHTLLDSHSMPPTRPGSRQSEFNNTTTTNNNQSSDDDCGAEGLVEMNPLQMQQSGSNLSSMETWTKNSLDEQQFKDTFNINDRLSLTLEEIVHIRSVMTKAELESLPVEVRIKEDVEKRKVCFLCLRTRFSIFSQRGVPCKLCQRTVCAKCYSKMRIPTEHFRNVPVILLSPSLMCSPVQSNAPSPSHHGHHHSHTGHNSLLDESFPRSLMERLLRPELDRKTRNTVGSAPSSPKTQRSSTITPGGGSSQDHSHSHQQSSMMTSSLIGTASTSTINGITMTTTNGAKDNYQQQQSQMQTTVTFNPLMSRSMEGPRSLQPQSPARQSNSHSNSSTLERKSRFSRAFTLSSSAASQPDQKDGIRGELMAVCNDCRSLVLEIIRSSRQTRSSARNDAIRHLTLDLSPVYKS